MIQGRTKQLLRPVNDSSQITHEFTLIIPAFNEESRLPWTLAEVRRYLDASGLDYRVLVADDGSSDATPSLAPQFGERFATAKLDRHRGKGAAVRNAMLQATGRVIAFTDADLPFELDAVQEAYRKVANGNYEVAFGARDLAQSASNARRKISRTIATWVFREVVKRLVSREVTDTQCGLKAFSFRAAKELFSRVTLDGFSFDAEVVSLTQRLELKYCRVPVKLVREYGSTLSLRRDTLPMLGDILGLWWRNRSLQALPSTELETASRNLRIDGKFAA